MIKKRGNVYYHTSAGGFILSGKKLLMVKNYYHGGIVPPHGHQEKGETLLETAKREICEETGYCHLQAIKKLGPVHYSYTHKGALHKKTEHRWLFKLTSNKRSPKQTDEAESLENRWYTLSGALKAATFENTKIHIREIIKYLRQKES